MTQESEKTPNTPKLILRTIEGVIDNNEPLTYGIFKNFIKLLNNVPKIDKNHGKIENYLETALGLLNYLYDNKISVVEELSGAGEFTHPPEKLSKHLFEKLDYLFNYETGCRDTEIQDKFDEFAEKFFDKGIEEINNLISLSKEYEKIESEEFKLDQIEQIVEHCLGIVFRIRKNFLRLARVTTQSKLEDSLGELEALLQGKKNKNKEALHPHKQIWSVKNQYGLF